MAAKLGQLSPPPAIEELVKNRYELPSFATLDRLVSHIRTRVNQTLFTRVTSPLSHEFKQQLNEMFETQNHRQRSFYNDLKKLPQKSSRNHLNDLFVHLTWLETLGDVDSAIATLTPGKRDHFASEAKALNASELKEMKAPKRLTLLLSLIHSAHVQTRDNMVFLSGSFSVAIALLPPMMSNNKRRLSNTMT